MAIAFDGSYALDSLPRMSCGGTPLFDNGSGYGYRCNTCGAVIGSIGQPRNCVEENKTNTAEYQNQCRELEEIARRKRGMR